MPMLGERNLPKKSKSCNFEMKSRKAYTNPIDKKILLVTLALCVIGLILLSSASAVVSFQRYGHNYYYLTRQAIFVLVSLVLMLLITRINYRIFKKYSLLILFISGALLLAVLVPGLGLEIGSARRWLGIGPLPFQVSELAKLAVIFYTAAWFDSRQDRVRSFYRGLLPHLCVVGAIAALIMLEPDLGSTSALLIIVASMYFAGGALISHITGLFVAGLGVLWMLIQAAPYRLARITAFLDPSIDPLGIGYHINQALLAVGSGGLWGYGFGESRQKFNFLPEPIGDSIFAITAEELGFVRIVAILLLYVLFAYFGYKIAKNAPDRFGSLVAVGITSWICFQAIFNVGAMIGLLPLTGIPLPFISNGGTAILMNLTAVGVLLSISKES